MARVSGSCCLLENRPQFFVWLLALNRIGASVVPVNPDLGMPNSPIWPAIPSPR
jgi:acyl-CoA synthetase (AMP-forming)/AMP-acid ligase II